MGELPHISSGDAAGLLNSYLGVGFKPVHFSELYGSGNNKAIEHVGWIEVHAENYMGRGGLLPARLRALQETYALSLHGVGLSLGSEDGLDKEHLTRLVELVSDYSPFLVSEHLAWSSHGGRYLNDLLPLPYTNEVLDRVCRHVDEVQSALGRQILIENPSTYLGFDTSHIPEPTFLESMANRTGCGLLLDVNNIYVSCRNSGVNPDDYLDDFPVNRVVEIHLAGYAEDQTPEGVLLIDNHGGPVSPPVWDLFHRLIGKTGYLPTLIEWDTNIPDWNILHKEVLKAREVMSAAHQAYSLEKAG